MGSRAWMVSQCVSSSIWGFVRLGRGTAALVAPVQLGAAVRKQMVNRVRITARSASFTQAPDPILPYPRNMFSPLSKADQAHWLSVLEKLRNPRAVSLASQLDTACVLGVGDLRKWGTPHQPAAFEIFKRVKTQYPRHVVLVRVGKFYEAVGYDAILLVEFAGLNPMAEDVGVPQAGCPASSLTGILKCLLEQDLCVVICEEIDYARTSYKNAKAKKNRFISQVLTPQNPTYLHGLVDSSVDPEFPVEVRPLFAIAHTTSGFMTMEYKADTKTIYTSQNLTEEAVWSQLRRQRVSAPIYLHNSLTVDNCVPQGWDQRIKEVAPSLSASVEVYKAGDPIEGFCSLLAKHFRWGAGDRPKLETQDPSKTVQQPPPFSTMQAIGLVSSFGVCPLVDSLVTKSTTMLARSWLRKVLLVPPPPEIVSHIYAANVFLMETMEPIPYFRADMQPYKIVQVIGSLCGSEKFFRRLDSILSGVLTVLEDRFSGLHEHILPLAMHTAQLSADRESLISSCNTVREEISKFIPMSYTDSDSDDSFEDNGANGSVSGDLSGSEDLESGDSEFLSPLDKFFMRSRSQLMGRVHERCIEREWKKLMAVERRITKEIHTLHQSIRDQVASEDATLVAKHLHLVHDVENKAVWFKIGQPLLKLLDETAIGFLHPNDRNAIRLRDVFSSEELESALVRHRVECDNISSKIRSILEDLCETVQPLIPYMCVASCLATVTLALTAHIQCALEKSWTLPDISRMLDSEEGNIVVNDFWPYWMPHCPQTVTNTVNIDGMILLTGCNMGGKSTVLRSIASICALASCGLAVPASSASLPFVDAVVLRTFLGDSQVDGQSAFAVEMNHMASVLKTATNNSLVLVDELGKGTEVCVGASLCASMLKALAVRGCKGLFATHFHHLVDFFHGNQIGVKPMQMMAEMKGATQNGSLPYDVKMHWRLVEGSSQVSSGFQVALQKGVPEEIVVRAVELSESLNDSPPAV